MRSEITLRGYLERGDVIGILRLVSLTLVGVKERKLESEITIKNIKENPDKFIELLETLKNSSKLYVYRKELLTNRLKNIEKELIDNLIKECIKDIEGIDKYEAIKKIMNIDIEKFNAKGGISIPDEIMDIMLNVSNIKENESVVNPYNGQGEIQIAIESYKIKNNIENLKYYGQEINEELAAIGELISFIMGNDSFIKQGNSILGLNFDKKFDCCISVPPFISRIEDMEVYNKIARDFKYGKLSRSSSWITINPIINNLNEKGRATILSPLGILFRSGSDEDIRKNLIKEDMIDTIIELPIGILMPYTGVATCILVLNKNKEEHRKGKIQLIDLSNYVEKVNRRSTAISQEGIDTAIKLYNEFLEKQGVSKIVDTHHLEANNYNLQPSKNISMDSLDIEDIDMVELQNVVSKIRRGVQIPKQKLDEINQGDNRTHYYIGLRNVLEDGSFSFEDTDKVRVESKWKDLYEVEIGDIIMPSKSSTSKLAIVDESVGKAIVSANMMLIRLNDKKYKPEVLKYFLESELGQKLLDSIKVGSVIMSISPKDMEKLLIPNIDINEQIEIVNMIEKSNKEYQEAIQQAENKYIEDKKTINNKLFI